MKISEIFEGKPFMTEFGIVGYSSVVLIQADGKNILFDCGLRGCAIELKAGLAANGISCDDITDVVISHMHFDHVGNLPLFKNAVIHISETEWKEVNSNPDEWHCIQTREYIKQSRRIHFVKENDLIADGVEVLELPGHTLGLIGLRCGNRILCSDAIKNRFEMWEELPLMAANVELSRKTQDRIKKEAEYIYTGHDTILETNMPINREEISFKLKFADGNYIPVSYSK